MFKNPPITRETDNILKITKREHESTDYNFEHDGNDSEFTTLECYMKDFNKTRQHFESQVKVDVTEDAIFESLFMRENIKQEYLDKSKENNLEYSCTDIESTTSQCYMNDSTADNFGVDIIDNDELESCINQESNYFPSVVSTINDKSHVEKEPTNYNLSNIASTATSTQTKHQVITPRKYARKKQYHCRICDFHFVYSSSLRRHNIIHRNDDLLYQNAKKPYKCDFCRKSFLQKESTRKHIIRFHEGESPYVKIPLRYLFPACIKK